jgi:uncharacterized Ntn-hydrolase superfamily protein
MTFSIVARCAETGMFGIAVSSSSPAVAARCAHARAGVGAVASQNITDPSLGPRTLDLMELGAGAPEAIDIIRRGPKLAYRQVLAVDCKGRTAIHSGTKVLGRWAEAQAENVACAGNLLKADRVPQAMVDAFSGARGHLAARLLAAMQAAVDAGGEEGPVHSAGLKIVDKVSWPVADLRVDWTEACPVAALRDLWRVYEPQLEAYVTRALDPDAAPTYGVPGDV